MMEHDLLCREFEDRISSYVDGDLDASENRDFERHRKECSICSMLMDTVSENVAFMSNIPEVEPTSHFTEKVISATSSAPRGLKKRATAFLGLGMADFRWVPAAVAALFVMALCVNVFWAPPGSNASSKEGRSEVSVFLDDAANKVFSRAVKFYKTLSDAWDAAASFAERAGDFFQTKWEQVKGVFGGEKKKKPEPQRDRKDLNKSGFIRKTGQCLA